jgi:hypothetical protein
MDISLIQQSIQTAQQQLAVLKEHKGEPARSKITQIQQSLQAVQEELSNLTVREATVPPLMSASTSAFGPDFWISARTGNIIWFDSDPNPPRARPAGGKGRGGREWTRATPYQAEVGRQQIMQVKAENAKAKAERNALAKAKANEEAAEINSERRYRNKKPLYNEKYKDEFPLLREDLVEGRIYAWPGRPGGSHAGKVYSNAEPPRYLGTFTGIGSSPTQLTFDVGITYRKLNTEEGDRFKELPDVWSDEQIRADMRTADQWFRDNGYVKRDGTVIPTAQYTLGDRSTPLKPDELSALEAKGIKISGGAYTQKYKSRSRRSLRLTHKLRLLRDW